MKSPPAQIDSLRGRRRANSEHDRPPHLERGGRCLPEAVQRLLGPLTPGNLLLVPGRTPAPRALLQPPNDLLHRLAALESLIDPSSALAEREERKRDETPRGDKNERDPKTPDPTQPLRFLVPQFQDTIDVPTSTIVNASARVHYKIPWGCSVAGGFEIASTPGCSRPGRVRSGSSLDEPSEEPWSWERPSIF